MDIRDAADSLTQELLELFDRLSFMVGVAGNRLMVYAHKPFVMEAIRSIVLFNGYEVEARWIGRIKLL